MEIVKYLWQLPQNLLGLLIIKLLSASAGQNCFIAYHYPRYFAVSLGTYIIFGKHYGGHLTHKHETGHQKQSLYLGWLYLIIIGIPSAVGNLLHRVWKFDYYRQPWERWADKLGGVVR